MKNPFKKSVKCTKCNSCHKLIDILPILKGQDKIFIYNEASYFIPAEATVIFAWTETTALMKCNESVKEQFVIYKTKNGNFIRCTRPMRTGYEHRYAEIDHITEDDAKEIIIGIRNNARNFDYTEILVDEFPIDYTEI